MSIEQKANAIISKIRSMYKYDTELSSVVKSDPSIKLNCRFDIECVEFKNYDTLYVYPDSMVFAPEVGNCRKILNYKNYDELLAM